MQERDAIAGLKKLLADGQDNALIRFGLGSALLNQHETGEAIQHLERAVELDDNYSAAWKLLGKAYQISGDVESARASYRRGIEIAERRGDLQAAKEMRVFLRRLDSSS